MTEKKTLEESIAGLYFDYACRALMGGGKGMYVMLQLYQDSPESYRVMIEGARLHLLKAHNMPLERLLEQQRDLETMIKDLERERSN